MSFYNENQRKKTFNRLSIILIIAGLFLSIDSFIKVAVIYKFWPLSVVILAIGFLRIFIHRNKRELFLFGTGIYLLLFAVLALYCNFTSWANLQFAWPFFILSMGIVLLTASFYSRKRYPLFLTGLMLLSLALFFFLMFFIGSQYWWIIVVLTGINVFVAEKIR